MKNKRILFYFVFVLSIIWATKLYAGTLVNSGFIPGQIWYSSESLIEGQMVNIHTAVWNGDKNPLSIKVEFYDKNVILGSRDINLASLELKDVFIPWKVTSGDHIISAKIISSLATISGNKEKIILGNNKTENDKQFVSVLVKDEQGLPISNTNILKNQIDKTSSDIADIIPEKVNDYMSTNMAGLDSFREKNSKQINIIKKETIKEIEILKNEESVEKQNAKQKNNLEDAVHKPITYIKLFIVSVLAFILGSKIIFYLVLILILFYILRFIYRRIRKR